MNEHQTESQDIRTWTPERRLDFYESMFFDGRVALWSFGQLPVEQRRHIVARCLEDMEKLGWTDHGLGVIIDMTELQCELELETAAAGPSKAPRSGGGRPLAYSWSSGNAG